MPAVVIESPDGLSDREAAARLATDGPNVLPSPPARSPARLLLSQLVNPLIALLLGGAVVSAAVGHWVDAIAITVIVGINAVVGFVQEFRAEQAVAALQELTAPRATVLRGGHASVVPAASIVVGDVLILEPGDIVPADAELTNAHNLSTNEAVLTGESLPVDKSVGATAASAPLAEHFGHVFLGTAIASGVGRATVRATAGATQMGSIAAALAQPTTTSTPLQERLAGLGRVIVVGCIGLVAIVAVAATLRGLPWLEVLLTSISLAVAAVPEGLPTVVTIALAVGVHRMARRGVLVRRLSAVETLGSATVICTDKTGTLTRGVMEVRELWGERREVLWAAASASTATLDADGSGTGDTTELAILRAAREVGIDRAEIDAEYACVALEPFDSATRRMSILRSDGRIYIKGAFEAVLPECGEAPGARDAHERLATRGLRVLAVAAGSPGAVTLLGLIGLADPPRAEALDAVRQARRAGIRVVMITGDHPQTARAIARELELGNTDDELDAVVFARATAADKLRIVAKLKADGEIVAMTGDGVNDAPSIREADIGVAMGKTATEVTRGAADMILTDDALSGIVAAIREGRVIYANIRKTIVYLLGGNASELLYVLTAALAGLPMPLLPLQLLWINLLGEPLPGIALAIDAPSGDVLELPPRPRSEPILGRAQWLEIAMVAAGQAAVVTAAFVWSLGAHDLATARTLGFSALVFGVVFRSLASRSDALIYWQLETGSNRRLAAVVVGSVALQIAIVYIPATSALFGLSPLPLPLLGLALALGIVPVSLIEITKLMRVRGRRSRRPL